MNVMPDTSLSGLNRFQLYNCRSRVVRREEEALTSPDLSVRVATEEERSPCWIDLTEYSGIVVDLRSRHGNPWV